MEIWDCEIVRASRNSCHGSQERRQRTGKLTEGIVKILRTKDRNGFSLKKKAVAKMRLKTSFWLQLSFVTQVPVHFVTIILRFFC